MSIDIRQFHAGFFEESLEGLALMETSLLEMEAGQTTSETLHAIFRAAHSIKGGAGSFGFARISEATHHLETLLDELRSDRRTADAEVLKVLYQSVDGVRAMILAAQAEQPCPEAQVQAFEAALKVVLGTSSGDKAVAPESVATAAPVPAKATWTIRFAPAPTLLVTGNEPILLMQALAELGELSGTLIEPTGEEIALETLAPDDCRLAWDLTLVTESDEAAIRDVFSWVDDCAELRVSRVEAPAAHVEAAPEPTVQSVVAEVAKAASSSTPAQLPTASIRVGVDKVDALIDLVGELVITQAMLHQQASELDPVLNQRLLTGMAQLERNTRDLQEAVMSVRMMPVGTVFSRFPRMVRDLATRLNKEVRLKTVGEATELDKGVIERIIDPLNHLVRNSLDHGIETPDIRRAAGKPEQAEITLSATHQGGYIILQVADDGRGLDRERILASARKRGIDAPDSLSDDAVWQMIFAPGLSTADAVTDVSGRGVGMDVVKQNINALGGSLDIASRKGQGTTVTIRLPLTLAILDGMSVAVGDEVFIIPLAQVVESLQPQASDIKRLPDGSRVVKVRDEYLPLRVMHELFGVPSPATAPEEAVLVLVEAEGRRFALQIDALVGQQQVVIKNLESNYRRVRGISGATILGDGHVALILDIGNLARDFARAA